MLKSFIAIAQFETEIRVEHQMDGINKAKERGVAFGRKKKMTPQQIEELRERRKSGTLIKTLILANYPNFYRSPASPNFL